jgi:hypothetical protein
MISYDMLSVYAASRWRAQAYHKLDQTHSVRQVAEEVGHG